MNKKLKPAPQFYFALPRLLAGLRGGATARSERNALEAQLIGLIMYLIHYLFFATQFIPSELAPWSTGLLLILLVFWVWLFWLLLLYISSIVIELLRPTGLFRSIPMRRAQSILWGLVTTAMACALLRSSPWAHEIGAIWLVAVAMNLAAALVLAIRSTDEVST